MHLTQHLLFSNFKPLIQFYYEEFENADLVMLLVHQWDQDKL